MRIPLLNFELGPGVLLSNIEGGPGVPLLNFRKVFFKDFLSQRLQLKR